MLTQITIQGSNTVIWQVTRLPIDYSTNPQINLWTAHAFNISIFCGPTWIRTTDTCIFSAVLYQLSYRPLYNKVYLEGTPGFEPVDKGNVTSRAVTNHHPQIHLKVCGPEGNRTLHSLLAREKRQALEHASPIKLFYKWKAVKPPYIAGRVGFEPTVEYYSSG